MALFDLTANTNARKVHILNVEYPKDVTMKATDGNATFTAVIAKDGRPDKYTYQWYVNGAPVAGATNATYVRNVSGDKGQYTVWCEVANKAGTVRTREATLTVKRLPVLNGSYPANVSVSIGSSATFRVVISEDGYPANYSYQWYLNGAAVSGATGTSYTRTGSAAANENVYCVVTNEAGSVTSRKATFTVNPEYLWNNGNFAPGLWVNGALSDADSYVDILNGNIRLHADGSGKTVAQLTERVDFTGKSKLVFRASYMTHTGSGTSLWHFGVADSIRTDAIDDSLIAHTYRFYDSEFTTGDVQYFVVDVSAINGYHYVKWHVDRNGYDWDTCNINGIYFE